MRIILIVWEKGWGFSGIGPPPTFWPFLVSLGTVLVSVGELLSILVYYSECMMRFKIYWKLNLLGSRT